jgi:hypothetical protein
MRYIVIIFLATFSFYIGSCQNKTKSTGKSNTALSDYCKWKNVFPDSLIKHFPDNIGKDWISYSSSYRNKPKKILYLTLLKKITEEERNYFQDKAFVPDSCIIEIYLNRNTYGFNKKGLGNCDMFMPVPNYSLIEEDKIKPKDLKYYILESSKKSFIDHDLYLRYYLPDEWKNGMSRGIGISEKEQTILYWLIMW